MVTTQNTSVCKKVRNSFKKTVYDKYLCIIKATFTLKIAP